MARYKRERAIHISRREPVTDELSVIIAGNLAGTLREHGDGYMSFVYDPSYRGPWLSVCLPNVDGAEHLDLDVRPVIEGLLPDNLAVRAAMARDAGFDSTNPFALLKRFGKDLPGAVQICDPAETASVLANTGLYVPASETEIAHRLMEAIDGSRPVWHGDDETWSLGGNQGKFALALIDGQWMRCEGSYPSTHILKPGVSGMPLQSLVEFVTMQVAGRVGLRVSKTSYEEFDGIGAIVVERYDRIRTNAGILRIHQEDFCQALGYLPSAKYEVVTADAIALVGAFAGVESMKGFADGLMFNYLVGGIDAHAKNYSLLHLRADETALAPLYDLASVLPYEKLGSSRWRKVPMTIGGNRRIGALTGADLDSFAATAGLPAEAVRSRMRYLAKTIPDAISDVGQSCPDIDGMDRVVAEMMRTVSANCRAMLANVDRGHADFVRPGLDVINGGCLPRGRGFLEGADSG